MHHHHIHYAHHLPTPISVDAVAIAWTVAIAVIIVMVFVLVLWTTTSNSEEDNLEGHNDMANDLVAQKVLYGEVVAARDNDDPRQLGIISNMRSRSTARTIVVVEKAKKECEELRVQAEETRSQFDMREQARRLHAEKLNALHEIELTDLQTELVIAQQRLDATRATAGR
jgi:hypothetical protein